MPHGRNVRSESSVVSSGRLNDTEESSPAADSFARLRAGRNGAEELEDSARGSSPDVDGCTWIRWQQSRSDHASHERSRQRRQWCASDLQPPLADSARCRGRLTSQRSGLARGSSEGAVLPRRSNHGCRRSATSIEPRQRYDIGPTRKSIPKGPSARYVLRYGAAEK